MYIHICLHERINGMYSAHGVSSELKAKRQLYRFCTGSLLNHLRESNAVLIILFFFLLFDRVFLSLKYSCGLFSSALFIRVLLLGADTV